MELSDKDINVISEDKSKKSKFLFDPTRRRSSAASIKSKKSISSSRRGSKVESDDEFDEDGLPQIPNITYRKGSIISFPITDDLPCMKNKRHSISSVSSDISEDVPPIVFRKGSLSTVYTIPDLLTLNSSIQEDLNEDSNGNAEEQKPKKEEVKKESESGESKEDRIIDFNEMLSLIGDFGKHQTNLILCSIPFLINYVVCRVLLECLILLPHQYWCHVPELSNLSLEQRLSLSIPTNSVNQSESCLMYNVNYSEILEFNQQTPDSNWSVTTCQNGWYYNLTAIPYASLAVQEDWVCDRQSYTVASRIIFFVGSIIGGLLFGWVADKFGRKYALIGTTIIGLIGAALILLSSEFILFAVSVFLIGVVHYNSLIFFFINVLENVGLKRRTFAVTLPFLLFYSLADIGYPWLASNVTDWRYLAAVSFLFLIIATVISFLIPESARWQYTNGHFEKAINSLKKMETINHSDIDSKMYTQLKKAPFTAHSSNYFQLLRSAYLRKYLVSCIVIWVSVKIIYFGAMHQSTNLNLTLFFTKSIFALTDLPSFICIVIVLDIWGRKWMMMGSLVLASVSLILSCIDSTGIWSSMLALACRLFINIAHVVLIQFAIELFPTVIRGQSLMMIQVFGSIASILAPLIILSTSVDVSLIIFGLFGLISALASTLLSETKDIQLPETVEDGKPHKKIFTL